jgi:hypothetical protein
LVFSGDSPHGAIIGAGGTLVTQPAKLFGNHSCLHPDTGIIAFFSPLV